MNSKNKIEKKFADLKNQGKKALIPFITGGYPDYDSYIGLFFELEKLGSDIIEIGMPFSDPMADGPVIQNSSRISLEKGFNTDLLFKSIKEIRKKTEIPVVIMTYFNIVYKYGIERFLSEAKSSGVDGLIIPDLPFEEYLMHKPVFDLYEKDIASIMLAALTTDNEKIKKISKYGSGFLYCVMLKGVTGTRNEIGFRALEFLKRARSNSELPVAAGFGISDAEQVKKVREYCDGIIIGSKIISIIEDRLGFTGVEYKNRIKQALENVGQFISEIREVI